MSVNETLVELAEERLTQMAPAPWSAFAAAIRKGKPGETFGCEVDGRYFDVGDQARWLEGPEGDILLVCYAVTQGAGRSNAKPSFPGCEVP
jgi:hypothetical protein